MKLPAFARLSGMKQARAVTIVVVACAVLAAIGATRLEVETDFTKNFRSGSSIATSYDYVEKHLGGAGVWDVIVPAPATLNDKFLADVRSLEQQRPHCVVLDLRMPHLNGFHVQRAMADAGTRLPVVIITGDDSPESRVLALAQGAKAYLRKPIDDAMLLDAIQTAMRAFV